MSAAAYVACALSELSKFAANFTDGTQTGVVNRSGARSLLTIFRAGLGDVSRALRLNLASRFVDVAQRLPFLGSFHKDASGPSSSSSSHGDAALGDALGDAKRRGDIGGAPAWADRGVCCCC